MGASIRPDGPRWTPLDRAVDRFQTPAAAEGTSFADTLARVVGDTQQVQQNAENVIAAFVRGEPVELHQVMAASEEAGIALEFLVEMRNKLTDAYRTVMNMQV